MNAIKHHTQASFALLHDHLPQPLQHHYSSADKTAPMIEILQPQPSMPLRTGHFRTDLPQEPQYPRYPLTQLPNQVQSTREGFRQTGNGLDPAKLVAQPTSMPSSAGSSYVSSSRTILNDDTTNLMLAPTYGGLYRASGYTNGSLQQSSRPKSPLHEVSPKHGGGQDANARAGVQDQSGETDQIAPYLQIPSTINSSKGSLSEFAAQITCLFWFESSFTLHRVEGSRNTPMPMSPLVSEAKPTLGFQKWVTTILSTTQVSTNVILLALMFIYRLKKLNPTVKGKPGSEYRLLTVALMLGNKFLDDNTYTNKTWAEVSGISVSEIHIMEVEFLSNMRYTLYASHDEWWAWHEQLSRFYDYFERASTAPMEVPPTTPFTPPSGNRSPYSSPPVSYISSAFRMQNVGSSARLAQSSAIPSYLQPVALSPATRIPEIELRPQTRKRSYDESFEEPQAKRLSRNLSSASTASNTPISQLPIPNVSRPIQQTNPLPLPYSAHLPPPTGRAMASVYGQQASMKSQSNGVPPLGIKIPSMDVPQNKALSSAAGSKSGSPINMMTPPTELLSPMNYNNIQRSSPYRPVRGVNTLLVPPPSASFQNPSQNVGSRDMHYQPLGKATERRTGVVPYMPQSYPPQPWNNQHHFHGRY